ncbi:MAG: DUF1553 domain-containing protein [Planctomycetaceae bacterium]
MRCVSAICVSLLFISAVSASETDSVSWSFDGADTISFETVGEAKVEDGGLTTPRYPTFEDSNRVLSLNAPAWLKIADQPDQYDFDFDNGDAVTFEAWVRVDSMGENVSLISKGRTEASGSKSTNQNWAFRLRQNKGQACVNFLFRSRSSDAHQGDWHRWTSDKGFSSGSRWHHVAVSYRFGDPKSIRGYIDGRAVKGSWDMGGETDQPPVVDDDDVLIGSTMGGAKGNSLQGAIDNVAIHRREVASEELISRFQWSPPEVKPPVVPPGKVVVQLFGPVDSISEFPQETDPAMLEWQQDDFAFVRLPHRYDDWGVRADWGATLLVRAWTDIQWPAGEYQILARSRGLARLKIDNDVLVTTSPQPNRGGAHHVVDELPEVPRQGMRPHAMSEQERVVPFTSDGKKHRVLYEMVIGGPKYRAEFGEACLAVAQADTMFQIVSAVSEYPLTDDGWLAFTENHSAWLTEFDRERRRDAAAKQDDYWQQRHDFAKTSLLQNVSPRSIDEIISERILAANQQAAEQKRKQQAATVTTEVTAAEAFFREHIQHIFDAHCIRCHGQKQQGELLLSDRSNLLAGGESGQAAIVPGKPDESYLFQLVSAPVGDYRMPPKGHGLTQPEVAAVRQWIADGAVMPTAEPVTVSVPPLVDDLTFLRRVYLDVVGVPPTVDEIRQFQSLPDKVRRSRVIEQLLDDDRWADNRVGYWQDVLAENPNLLKPTLNNTGPFRFWIHEALIDNKPLDRFATELIQMRGSKWGGGSAGFSVASQNDVPMAAKGHVVASAFLGVNMKCARCHDAPYHQWKQADLFQLAAMLDRKQLKLPETSSVPAAFFEAQTRKSLIEVSLKPGTPIEAEFPFSELTGVAENVPRLNPQDTREELAVQVTASRRFAEVMANRIWARLMGVGLVEPVDDWEGNPPSHPELLAALTDLLITSDYDLKRFTAAILNSQVYQRQTQDIPVPTQRYFAGPYRRRMSAEQVVDSAFHVAGQQMLTEMLTMDVEGTLPPDTFLNFGYPQRAWEFTTLANERDRPSLALPRAQTIVDVLKAFGWRDSRPEPEAHREDAPNLIQPAVLANGTLGLWLTRLSDESRLTSALTEEQSLDGVIDDLFLRFLTRSPTDAERRQFTELLQEGFADRVVPKSDIGTPWEAPRFRYVSWSNHLNTEANVIKVQMQELVRQGPPPTRYLKDSWRERAEDAIWTLLNSPEMVMIP